MSECARVCVSECVIEAAGFGVQGSEFGGWGSELRV